MQKKIILVGSILTCLLTGFFFWPLPNSLTNPPSREPLQVLDRTGELLYEVRKEDHGNQNFVALRSIPETITDALIATEDRTFYSHRGISPRGIARAFLQNIQAGKIVSGGSTITQQLVRIRLQPKKRGYLYKMLEAYLAMRLDAKMTKEEILQAYLNEGYFGHQAYGISAAAKTYFGKSLRELSQAESAYLVGLLQAPSSFDPFQNPKSAKERQELILQAMRDAGVIDTAEYDRLKQEPITLAADRTDIRAPHFVFWLLGKLSEEQLAQESIRTTLDLDLQTKTEEIIGYHLEKLRGKNVTSAAVVVLDAVTGELLTMVGSADYFDEKNDGAVNVAVSNRQPGSALKPFTYALALSQGSTAATTVADIETQFFTQEGNPYIPRNYDYGYHGLVRFREALANSYNIAAVKVLEKVGVANLVIFLQRAGFTTLTKSPEHYGLALTLGDAEVKLLELAQTYAIFPRGGETLPLNSLYDGSGEPRLSAAGNKILDPKVAWLITDILSDREARLPEFGINSPLNFTRPVAAKTGTTRNSRDNWTVGYTPERIVAVWVGNANNAPMKETSGVTGAGPIFHDVMVEALKDIPPSDFVRPPGLTKKTICALSGKLPTEFCPHTIDEWFIAGTEPQEPDDIFQNIAIDTRNGLRASESCDKRYREEKIYAIFPPELQTWARENGWLSPPNMFSPLCKTSAAQSHLGSFLAIEKPGPNESFQLSPLIPNESEKIIFQARASDDVRSIDWFVDGEKVGEGIAPSFRYEWAPKTGSFSIEARTGDKKDRRKIEVRD